MVKRKTVPTQSANASQKKRTLGRPKAATPARVSWDDEKRLALLLEIAYLEDIHLSEAKWHDIANKLGTTWNAARLQYGTLMGKRFPGWKRGSKNKELSTNLTRTDRSVDVGVQAGEVASTGGSAVVSADVDAPMFDDDNDDDEWEDCLSADDDLEPGESEDVTRIDSADI
ncbi:hypothetical protein BO82DRAFT_423574 [Aspergillus uvarum CBS 121591]|uniref:Myb-like domain-containing protein n=1 Tax=Aspergillus uvarum CBS 121591 TaxID=1448315 RepID=A0A319CPW0_9EURO|nr:hypothetical protein BO82DRAFT_423574 [Aspergillus uvarum CBS 121591]PYH77538.1 hypothetical protein BO82DRAFT_423574 [Aspergillus uvarum CBS 121591]